MSDIEEKKLLRDIALIPQTMNAMLSFLKGKGATTNATPNPVEGTSRFVRAEDTTKTYQKKSLAKLSELVQVNKDILKKNFGNLAGGLGKLLLIGGLLGWLLTGKGEFLNTMVKSFNKMFILPIAKIIDKFIMKLSGSVLKYGANAAEKLSKIFMKMIPKGVKNVATAGVKTAIGVGKAITSAPGMVLNIVKNKIGIKTLEKFAASATEIVVEEGTKEVGKVAGKYGLKAMMKSGSKLGLKALAKIPFLGTILGPVLGIWFAIDRYKKGDYIGALGEIASGIATMIPGAGTFISLGIDALLLLRDFKSPEIKKEENKGKLGGFSKAFVESIPFVSTIIHFQKMMKSKDKLSAWKEGALAFGGMIPGFGAIESLVNYFHGNKNIATGESFGQESGGSASGIGGYSPWSMTGTKPNYAPMGGSKWAESTQTINPKTGKKQNKYKFNAPWDALIDKETKDSPISGDVIRSMIMQESGGNPNAESPPNGKKGTAKGLAQFMDATAATWLRPYGWTNPNDSFDPNKAIPGMVHYMEYLYKQAGGGSDPNAVYKAMYDYHGHSTKADSVGAYSGSYVQTIASRMGEVAPTGSVASSNPAHMGAAYQFGGGTMAINTPALPPAQLASKLNTINASKSQIANPEMQELIQATKNNSITFKKALAELSITNKTSTRIGSAS